MATVTDHGWQEEGCSRHAVRRRQMLCLPVTLSYEGCPASYWRLTVSQDDRGRQAYLLSYLLTQHTCITNNHTKLRNGGFDSWLSTREFNRAINGVPTASYHTMKAALTAMQWKYKKAHNDTNAVSMLLTHWFCLLICNLKNFLIMLYDYAIVCPSLE